jgi:hypothetical protein
VSKAQFFFVAAVLFAPGVAVFALQSTEEVSIRFLMWEFFAVSKVIVILASTAVGAPNTIQKYPTRPPRESENTFSVPYFLSISRL